MPVAIPATLSAAVPAALHCLLRGRLVRRRCCRRCRLQAPLNGVLHHVMVPRHRQRRLLEASAEAVQGEHANRVLDLHGQRQQGGGAGWAWAADMLWLDVGVGLSTHGKSVIGAALQCKTTITPTTAWHHTRQPGFRQHRLARPAVMAPHLSPAMRNRGARRRSLRPRGRTWMPMFSMPSSRKVRTTDTGSSSQPR